MLILKSSKITIALKKMYNYNRYGSIEIYKNGIVKKFTKKKEMKSGFINAGVSLIKKDIFDNYELKENFSFENFLEKNYNYLKINTFLFENYFVDIGVPDDYNKFIKDSVKLF
jgi:D-glycero-alpha-D-manno-heptose 1-phosphate guanylyltransferase